MLNDPPTLEELLHALRRFPNHKAAGDNLLTADALKALSKDVNASNLHEPHAQPILFVLNLLQDIWNG